ncbi:DUF4139 domain-containing protein [Myxococcota bacterium]|nr:DUF4139 domain-containing protein [Myxococcota bacterium]MBU1899123.1 DUF4139 domain-containing protein [Myxococcota bacterium]
MATTHIRHVTLYRNGALIRREGIGHGAVEVWDLPLLHHSAALRARPAEGQIGDIEEIAALAMDPQAEARSVQDQALRAARVAQTALRREAGLIEARLRLLTQRAKPSTQPQPPSAAQLMTHQRGVSARLEALDARLIEIEEARRALEQQIKALEAVADRDPEPPRVRRGVRFVLSGVEAPTPFELEYFVEAARWVPTYLLDVREGQTSLRMDALIAQATGEDWADVEITVATADLEREATLPELTSWRIGVAQPAYKPAWRPLPEDLDALFAGYDRGATEATPPAPKATLEPPSPEPCSAVDYMPIEPWEVEEVALEKEAGLYDGVALEEAVYDEAPREDLSNLSCTRAGVIKADIADYQRLMEEMQRGGPPMDALKSKKRASGFLPSFGGGGPGGAPPAAMPAGAVAPPEGRHQPTRHLYLRLNGPSAPRRGRLEGVDPFAHLWSLIEDHEVSDIGVLRRAVAALEAAQRNLAALALPDGQRPKHEDGFHHLYPAGGTHSVPSDGRWRRVVVLKDEAPARTEYRVVPKMSGDVYRYCAVELKKGRPFPNGAMQVHIDGQYRATTHLDATGGGAPLSLNLGLEPAVRLVERVAHTEQADHRGLMSQTTRIETRVTLSLRSGLPSAAEILVFERVPDGRDAEGVEVRRLACQPEPEGLDEDPNGARLEGALRWRLSLPPHGHASIEYGYAIEIPAKMELRGGNRRD